MTLPPDPTILSLAWRIAADYAALPQVVAVALAGSQTSGAAEPGSDLDLYVYADVPIPMTDRARIATAGAAQSEVGNDFWEPGDEWIDAATGLGVDVMFRSPDWIEAQLDRLLVRHEASVGYSTCFWQNVRASLPLHDPRGWYAMLQQRAAAPYPEPLRRAIIARNHPILRHTQSSYRTQVRRAIARGDLVSVNHRVAALLASYFDILFAINRTPHPGEKRLLALAARCAAVPPGMVAQVTTLLHAAGQGDERLLTALDGLLDGLDALIGAEGFAVGGEHHG